MGKFDGVLLASDFDNTILNTERPRRTGCPIPPISQRNVEALRYFMDNGGRFAVATGRALPAFRIFAEQVPMNAPAVVCNGGALYDFKTERYLETMELPETIRPQGQDVLDRFPTAAVEAYHMDNVIHAVRPNEYTRQHEHVTHAGVQPVPTLLEVPMPLIKIMFEDDHEHLLAALVSGLRGVFLRQDSAGGHPEGRQQGSYGSSSGKASGDLHGSCLLRRGRKQRSLHADDGGRGVCPG